MASNAACCCVYVRPGELIVQGVAKDRGFYAPGVVRKLDVRTPARLGAAVRAAMERPGRSTSRTSKPFAEKRDRGKSLFEGAKLIVGEGGGHAMRVTPYRPGEPGEVYDFAPMRGGAVKVPGDDDEALGGAIVRAAKRLTPFAYARRNPVVVTESASIERASAGWSKSPSRSSCSGSTPSQMRWRAGSIARCRVGAAKVHASRARRSGPDFTRLRWSR
jgi:hypothetical protein